MLRDKLSKGKVTTMPRKLFPSDVLEQAQEIITGWNQISNPPPTLGAMTVNTFIVEFGSASTVDGQIRALEAQLNDKRMQRDAIYASLWDKTKRARAIVKGTYGDDSPQYELMGG